MFKTRAISACFLVAFLIPFVFVGGYFMAGCSWILSLIGYRELMRCCRLSGHLKKEEPLNDKGNVFGCFSALELIGYFGITGYYALLTFTEEKALLLVSLFVVLMLYMALYVFSFPKYNCREIMMSMFCFLYCPVMLSFIYQTWCLKNGLFAVILIFICSWGCDTAAYCVGMLMGKHKLAPILSPKKSIEGGIGGIVGAVILGVILGIFVVRCPLNEIWIFAFISAIGAVISQIGDLAASGIKRNENIKDYGRLIPGHGGIMDRFDSVIFTAPVIYVLTLIMFK